MYCAGVVYSLYVWPVHSCTLRIVGAEDFLCAVFVFGQVLIMTRVKRSKTKQTINLCKLFGNSIYSGATQTSLSPILFEERGGCTQVMYIVTAWFGFRTNHRLSRSPSLLISCSGSWPLREGRALALSLAFAAENLKNLPLALRAREKI